MKNKKTNFDAGGLLGQERIDPNKVILPKKTFIAPNRIDHRDLCLPTDYQGNTSECVGYTVAGYLEVKHWQKKHFPIQYDASAIYAEAKRIDPFDEEGTQLQYGIQAAKNIGYIKGDPYYIGASEKSLKFAILEYGVCLGAFNITSAWNIQNKMTGRIAEKYYSQFIGGHAVLICGYDKEGVYIHNSWGKRWGTYGFGLLPWASFKKQFVYGAVIENIEIL
jgi:hypothetical protein